MLAPRHIKLDCKQIMLRKRLIKVRRGQIEHVAGRGRRAGDRRQQQQRGDSHRVGEFKEEELEKWRMQEILMMTLRANFYFRRIHFLSCRSPPEGLSIFSTFDP